MLAGGTPSAPELTVTLSVLVFPFFVRFSRSVRLGGVVGGMVFAGFKRALHHAICRRRFVEYDARLRRVS